MSPASALVPLAPHRAEALHLLAGASAELREAGLAGEARWADGLADAVRGGVLDGRLWVGPRDEAVALAAWEPAPETGREVHLYLAPPFRGPVPVARFAALVAEAAPEPIARVRPVGPLLPTGTLAAALRPLGLVPQERVDLVYPADRPLPAPTGAGAVALRPLSLADEPAVARLLERAYAAMPLERALFAARTDPAAEALRSARALLHGEIGSWWPDASFGVESPEGLAAATLVLDLDGPLLAEVMTDPEHRRRRFASALVARSVAAVRARGSAGPLRLVVTWSNVPARTLYLALGFVPVEATRGTVWVRPLPR